MAALLVMTFAGLLWRILALETQTRSAELDRAVAVGERILQLAVASPAVIAGLPPEQRAELAGGAVAVSDAIGWLTPGPDPSDDDPVVADRLERADWAEFAARDPAAAAAEHAALLAAPLPMAQRLQALAAAAWQAARAGQQASCRSHRDALDAAIATLAPSQLARPVIARAVASAFRLQQHDAPPPWAHRLLPALSPDLLAGCRLSPELTSELLARAERRTQLRRLAETWAGVTRDLQHGLLPCADGMLFAFHRHADGSGQVAMTPPATWFAALQAACQRNELPAWPWLVAPEFAPTPDASHRPLHPTAVPYLVGLRPVAGAGLLGQPWLLPALGGALVLLLGGAAFAQVRAQRREARALAAHAEFLTTVTHELKTPLASIRLIAEMLAEGRARDQHPEYFRLLAGESARLSLLIESVLDLGRLERGERNLAVHRFDLATAVRETTALWTPDGRDLELELPDAPVPVALDRAAVVQALLSVLDNARKYGVAPFVVSVIHRDGRAEVGVRDHGPGVPPGEREHIFERFQRGAAQQHGSIPGLGIGLYLARQLSRALGGELRCEPPRDAGPGAVFTFTWPTVTP